MTTSEQGAALEPTPRPLKLGSWLKWTDSDIEEFWNDWYLELLSTKEPQTQLTLWRQHEERKSSDKGPIIRPAGKCCLAIACDVLERAGVAAWADRNDSLREARFFWHGVAGDDAFTTTEWEDRFREKVKMSMHFQGVLVRMNDSYKLNFRQIAAEVRIYAMTIGINVSIDAREQLS